MRTSNNEYRNGILFNGYDYTNQAWVVNGVYVACGHVLPNPLTGKPTCCACYGKIHAGEPSIEQEPEVTEEEKTIARNVKRNKARRERNKAMQDMGLTRVKGALGGIYWE